MLLAAGRTVVSTALILLIGAGGGSMAVVDAFIFHDPAARSEAYLTHFEADSGCHADGCGVRSTAHAPSLPRPRFGEVWSLTPVGAAPEAPFSSRAPSTGTPALHHSRAPPRSA